jgi:hypothetical protein
LAYRVRYRKRAERDLDKLAEGVTLDWFDGLCDAIESLAEFRNRCAFTPEPILRQKGVRQLLYGGGTAILAVAAHGRDAHATSKGHAIYRILLSIAGSADRRVCGLRLFRTACHRLELIGYQPSPFR